MTAHTSIDTFTHRLFFTNRQITHTIQTDKVVTFAIKTRGSNISESRFKKISTYKKYQNEFLHHSIFLRSATIKKSRFPFLNPNNPRTDKHQKNVTPPMII